MKNLLLLLLVAATLEARPLRVAAEYHLTMRADRPWMLSVTASLPIEGARLDMAQTRPANVAGVGDDGWPSLIRNLRVTGSEQRQVDAARAGEGGWRLAQPLIGRVTLQYEVDYSSLAASGWPAARETAFADADHFMAIGRSLFITTSATEASRVAFDLPRGWRPLTPWQPAGANRFVVSSVEALVDNLIVLSRSGADVVTARGFRLQIAAMGHWKEARPEIRRMLAPVIERYVRMMAFHGRENYLVVLLPKLDRGGESFRNSFALTVDTPPSEASSNVWANTIAHEIFHYWNGWRLRGADYPSSQWFQEGFTEYVANISLVASGGITSQQFLEKLTNHIQNYARLSAALDAGGTRKGPPLYSGGALVAFSWDVMIRDATGGRRSLADFMRALWNETDRGKRPYEWRDVHAALDRTAPRDWDAFYRAYIHGTERLPLGRVLALAGLRLDPSSRVEIDRAAPARARSIEKALMPGER